MMQSPRTCWQSLSGFVGARESPCAVQPEGAGPQEPRARGTDHTQSRTRPALLPAQAKQLPLIHPQGWAPSCTSHSP